LKYSLNDIVGYAPVPSSELRLKQQDAVISPFLCLTVSFLGFNQLLYPTHRIAN